VIGRGDVLENVVVGADDTATGEAAVQGAVALLRGSGGTLHIVNGYKPRLPDREDLPTELRYSVSSGCHAEAVLRRLASLAEEERVAVVTHPVTADPVEAITTVAAEAHADLIVVAHRRGRLMHGVHRSVSAMLTRRAPCAVMIVPVN